MVTDTLNLCSALTHPSAHTQQWIHTQSSAHSQQWTHTPWKHTQSSEHTHSSEHTPGAVHTHPEQWTHTQQWTHTPWKHSRSSAHSQQWTHTAVNTHSSAHTQQCTHTHSNEQTHIMNTHPEQCTHTAWTHTRSSVQSFMLWRPGSSWGFGALLKGTSSWYRRWRKRCTFTPPPFLLAREPFDYELDSLHQATTSHKTDWMIQYSVIRVTFHHLLV